MKKDWEGVKDQIRGLYIVDKKPLDEVMRLMKGSHNFIASERSYKTQLAKWGYVKYKTEKRSHTRRPRKTFPRRNLPVNSSVAQANSERQVVEHKHGLLSTDTPSHLYTFDRALSNFGTTPDTNVLAVTDYALLGGLHLIHPSPVEPNLYINLQDCEGMTQLHRAAIDGSQDTAFALLRDGASVHTRDRTGNQPLHYAVSQGFKNVVGLLMKSGADAGSKGRHGRSALHMSVYETFLPILKVLLDYKPALSSRDMDGNTPLHLAILECPIRAVDAFGNIATELLLAAGADVNAANTDGLTPFQLLVERDHSVSATGIFSKLVRICLESGADISSRINRDKVPFGHELPFDQRLPFDHRLPFEVFLERSSFSWIQRGDRQLSSGSQEARACFKSFLGRGADVHVKLPSGELLPHEFFQHNYDLRFGADYEIAKLLCEKANPNKVGQTGDSLVHHLLAHATLGSKRAPVAALIEITLLQGANLNRQNEKGQTPLMKLLNGQREDGKQDVFREALEATNLLLSAGADHMIRDNAGDLPIYSAVRDVPKVAWELGQSFLLAAIMLEDLVAGDRECRNEDNVLPDRIWWENWKLAVTEVTSTLRTEDWEKAKQRLLYTKLCLPSDVKEVVYSSALCALAEYIVQDTRKNMESKEATRNYVAKVLRDIRESGLDVKQSWIDFFLGLCL